MLLRSCLLLWLLTAAVLVPSSVGAAEQPKDLVGGIKPLAMILGGQHRQFGLTGTVQLPIDGRAQKISVNLVRYSDSSFDLSLEHEEYAIILRRRDDVTFLALPRHGTAFVGRGAVPAEDQLAPAGLAQRLISPAADMSFVSLALTLLGNDNIEETLKSFAGIAKLELTSATGKWVTGNTELTFPQAGTVELKSGDVQVQLVTTATVGSG